MMKSIPQPMPPNLAARRVLLTGSSGTLGYHVMAELGTRKNLEARTVGRSKKEEAPGENGSAHEVIDFEDKDQLAAVFRRFKPTHVIHCAGGGMIYPTERWFKLVQFNVDTTLTLFELASEIPGCHFVHVSTGLVYRATGAPLCETDPLESLHPYGASKAAADILLRSGAHAFNVPLTLFRPFSFTGPNDNKTRLFPSILRAASEGVPVPLSPGDQVRDFCSARDIARGIVTVIDLPSPEERPIIFNLGSGRALPIREVIENVVDRLQIPVKLEFGTKTCGDAEPRHLVANIYRAQRELGWSPQHRLAHAVWQLAKVSFPLLDLREPEEFLAP